MVFSATLVSVSWIMWLQCFIETVVSYLWDINNN
jgi:hypothetical protein